MQQRPSEFLDWNNDGSKGIQPSLYTRENGYPENSALPTQHFNWILTRIDKWIKFLDYIKVNISRRIQPGNGLTGGGNLSTDVSLSVLNKDESINVDSLGISVNRTNDFTGNSSDKLLTQQGAKELYDLLENLSDDIEELSESSNFTRIQKLSSDRKWVLKGKYNDDIFIGSLTSSENIPGSYHIQTIFFSNLIIPTFNKIPTKSWSFDTSSPVKNDLYLELKPNQIRIEKIRNNITWGGKVTIPISTFTN